MSYDAQIVNYTGLDPDHQNEEIAVVFNGVDLTVGIYDVTTKGIFDLTQNPPIIISETAYAGALTRPLGPVTPGKIGDGEKRALVFRL